MAYLVLEYLMLLYVNSLFTDGSSELSKELSTFSGKLHVLVSSFNLSMMSDTYNNIMSPSVAKTRGLL